MNTAGTGTFSTIGYVVMEVAAIGCAVLLLRDIGSRLRAPRPAALAITAVVAVPSLIELGWHGIYTALYRAPDQIRLHHQYWRLLTGSIVQDGGLEGTIYNLILLFVIATLAVYLWGPGRATGLFLTGVIGFNVLATWAFASPGGGNSGATFFVATSLVGLAVVQRRVVQTVLAAVVIVVDGAVLIATDDAHGIPILAGLAVGVVLAAMRGTAGEGGADGAGVRRGARAV
jgi:hypothetical protein